MLRVGLIGFGLAGQCFHASIIRGVPGLELACILERTANLAKQKYPEVRVARTLDELLSDDQIKLCVIATSNDSHFEIARRCVLAGRDVVVDKPFTTTYRDAKELVRLAGEHQRLISVYQNRRWDGDFQTIKKLLQSGVLGDITEYEARYDRFRPDPKPNAWRERSVPGAGVLFDLGPHVIDQALLLFGPPQAVTAKLLQQRAWSPVDDGFDVFLEYPRFRALVRSRMLAYAPGAHFLIHGTKGSFVKYGMDPQEDVLRGTGPPVGTDWGPNWGREAEDRWGTLSPADGSAPRKIETEAGDYRRFYADIRDAILHGRPADVTPQHALNTMLALELAQQSSREQRTVAWEE